MLAVALVAFILCWGPAMLFDLVTNIYQWKNLAVIHGSARVSIALNSLGICNSFFNPLIYFTFSRYVNGFFATTAYILINAQNTWRETKFSGTQLKATAHIDLYAITLCLTRLRKVNLRLFSVVKPNNLRPRLND